MGAIDPTLTTSSVSSSLPQEPASARAESEELTTSGAEHRQSLKAAGLAACSSASPSVSVTPAMISAATRVLRESGFLWCESSADSLLARKMLETALSCRQEVRARCTGE